MNLKVPFKFNTFLCVRMQNVLNGRYFTSTVKGINISSTDKDSTYDTVEKVPYSSWDDMTDEEKFQLQQKRNKSRLSREHRNILLGQPPYKKSIEWFHNTIKYKKRMLGRYGMGAVKEPAGFAWPTPEEVEDMKEYERVAYPYSIQEEWSRIEEKNRKEKEAIAAREADISAKLIKMDKWIADLNARMAKKEADMIAAKEKRERLIAEVRLEVGTHIPEHDEKFKEALMKKEKQEKKKQKEIKKLMREEKVATKATSTIEKNIPVEIVDNAPVDKPVK